MSDSIEDKIAEAIRNPKNQGELPEADAVGTAGSPGCGDMMRVWLKFTKSPDGEKIIDRASFQAFGCETAIAVASVATEMLAGKTVSEARALSGPELAAPLGALPPMKIHCATLVEEALRFALEENTLPQKSTAPRSEGNLAEALAPSKSTGGRIVFLPPTK